MKRFLHIALVFCLLLALAACGSPEPEATAEPAISQTVQTPAPTAEPTAAPTPEPTPEPGPLEGYTATDMDWAGKYRTYVEDNFDVISALWPDGMSGVGFVDFDLDGVPEMLLFDMGASATLGAQLFDIVQEEVVCVSSVNEAAAAAFGGEHFSALSVCASYFEDFRLVRDDSGCYFRVKSANGALESCWEEHIRFVRGENDCLSLESLCRLETESDVEGGTISAEYFYVNGQEASREEHEQAFEAIVAAEDLEYEAAGVFLWNDMERYDTSLEGLLVMVDDAAAACTPLA